ncbi:MAG: hypothetical protein IPL26_29550 [Leptospiraceae bacterium]|nr:hypothetical protein [Leptospiraceae bacterium]
MNKSSNRFFANSFGFRILPNIILCLSLGFLGSLFFKNAYQEIKLIENEDVFFQAAKLVLGIVFIVGFILKRVLSGLKGLYLEFTVIFLLIMEMITLNGYSSGLLQVDYIFYTDIFLFFASLNSFVTGMLAAKLKSFRLWAFLTGGTSFIVYTYFNPTVQIKSENYLMPLVFVITLELILFSIISKSHNFSQVQVQKTYSINDIFFYSSLSLFVCHSIMYYTKMTVPDYFILGAGLGLLLFNIVFHFRFLINKIKWKYLVGRVIIIVSLILTLHGSRFELASGILLFMDMACIAIYRPEKYKVQIVSLSFVGGLILYLLIYYLNIYYLRYEFRYLFVFIFILLVWMPLIIVKSVKLVNKSLTILFSFVLAAYFFSPLPYDYKMNFVKAENLKPIPFLLTSIGLNQEKFVYFNSNLPFISEETLPKKNTFKNKTIVLGLGDNLEITLTYLYHLNKNGYPFIIFQDKNSRHLTNRLIDFESIEYPLFRIYFPKDSIPSLKIEKENESRGQSWEKIHIETRLKGLETNEDIADIISNLLSYSSGSLHDEALVYRNKFYNSYKEYAEYYFRINDYDRAIQMANLAFKFHIQDDNLLEVAYDSLLRITTEKEQISVMKILLSKNKYKEQIIKRLYPLLLTLNKKEEALDKINDLIEFYSKESSDRTEELKNLKIEKAKIYLQFSNIREAEEIIMAESRKNSNSVVWQKLLSDLVSLKESTYKIYTNPVVNTNLPPRSLE